MKKVDSVTNMIRPFKIVPLVCVQKFVQSYACAKTKHNLRKITMRQGLRTSLLRVYQTRPSFTRVSRSENQPYLNVTISRSLHLVLVVRGLFQGFLSCCGLMARCHSNIRNHALLLISSKIGDSSRSLHSVTVASLMQEQSLLQLTTY